MTAIGLGPAWLAGTGTTMAAMLAAVFATAGVVKLRSPQQTARSFADLGLPGRRALARPLAVGVPLVELAIAAVLVVRPGIGGMIAAVTMVAFTVVVLAVLRSGRSVTCGCLGALDDGPVSTTTVARNLVLVAMAVTAAVTVGSAGPVRPTAPAALTAVSLMLLGGLGVQVLAVQRTIGRIWSVALAGEAGREPAEEPVSTESASALETMGRTA